MDDGVSSIGPPNSGDCSEVNLFRLKSAGACVKKYPDIQSADGLDSFSTLLPLQLSFFLLLRAARYL